MDAKLIVVSLDHHFTIHQNDVYTDLAFGYDYWREYLERFDSVLVVARTKRVSQRPPSTILATGPGVTFLSVRDFVGPVQFLFAAPGILLSTYHAAQREAAFLLRNGTISSSLWIWLRVLRKPFGREVQGDLRESVKSWIGGRRSATLARQPLALLVDALSSLQIRQASAVAYVSNTLQARYPSSPEAKTFVFSGVQLGGSAVTAPRPRSVFAERAALGWRLLFIGRLEAEKGPDILLRSLASIRDDHPDLLWTVTLVGPGAMMDELEALAQSLGIADRTVFAGPVSPGAGVRAHIDGSDLLIVPSRTEGMPRAMIESMARGLPVVGSRAGGIPELLTADSVAAVGDILGLAAVIRNALDEDYLAGRSGVYFDCVTERFAPDTVLKAKHNFWAALEEGSK